MNVLTIGIAGGTGSGKTTVAEVIRDRFFDNVALVRQDDYYKAQHDLPFEERVKINYDHPDAFDTDLLAEHLALLQQGKAIECPVYDYALHDRSDRVRTVRPAPVLILDGILVLAEPRLRQMLDIKIFVDTDADVRILRRIRRDVHERGRTLDSVIAQYIKTVKPMHEAYVEPSKRYADVIVPEGGRNTVALDMLFSCIAAHMN